MSDRILTKLRTIWIIQALLDGNEHHTQEILETVAFFEFNYYAHCSFSDDGKGNYSSDARFFNPELIEPINNPKLSQILGELVKEEKNKKDNIVSRRPGDKNEDGRSGFFYQLNKTPKSLYNILKKVRDPQIPPHIQSHFTKDLKFWLLSQKYVQELINIDLVKSLEPPILTELLDKPENKDDRLLIEAILKMSPTALFNILYFHYDGKLPFTCEHHPNPCKEWFFMNLKFWLYSDIHGTVHFEKIYPDIKIIFDVNLYMKVGNIEVKPHKTRIESYDPIDFPKIEEEIEERERDKRKREKFEERWKEMGGEALNDPEMVYRRDWYDERDRMHKKGKLAGSCYENLRKLSEDKSLTGKRKLKKRGELITQYYEELDKI